MTERERVLWPPLHLRARASERVSRISRKLVADLRALKVVPSERVRAGDKVQLHAPHPRGGLLEAREAYTRVCSGMRNGFKGTRTGCEAIITRCRIPGMCAIDDGLATDSSFSPFVERAYVPARWIFRDVSSVIQRVLLYHVEGSHGDRYFERVESDGVAGERVDGRMSGWVRAYTRTRV